MFEINEPFMFVCFDIICRHNLRVYWIGHALMFGITAASMNIPVQWKTARRTRTLAVI